MNNHCTKQPDNQMKSERHIARPLSHLKRVLWLAAMITLFPLLAAASEPIQSDSLKGVSVTTSIDRDQARIAEPIDMKITVNAPQDVLVRFPESLKKIGTFDVVEMRDDLDIPVSNGRQFTRHLKLENIHAGQQNIPPVDVAFVDQRVQPSTSGFLQTDNKIVTINSSLEGPENPVEFHDIKGVVFLDIPESKTQTWIFWTTGGLLCSLALALVLVRSRRSLPPRQWALKALDDFEMSGDLFRANPELIYVTLTDIIRQFIQREYELSAPHLTTKEFLHELQTDSRLNSELRNQLSEFLQFADMVKFAGLAPDGETIQLALVTARKFITESELHADDTNHRPLPPGQDRFKEFE